MVLAFAHHLAANVWKENCARFCYKEEINIITFCYLEWIYWEWGCFSCKILKRSQTSLCIQQTSSVITLFYLSLFYKEVGDYNKSILQFLTIIRISSNHSPKWKNFMLQSHITTINLGTYSQEIELWLSIHNLSKTGPCSENEVPNTTHTHPPWSPKQE